MHAAQLPGEVVGVDGDETGGDDRPVGIRALVHADEQGGGVGPDVEAGIVVDLLVTLEEEPSTLGRRERHRVEHLAGAGLAGVVHEQVEAAVGDRYRALRQGGCRHGAGEQGLVLRVVDEAVDVGGGHGDGELEW